MSSNSQYDEMNVRSESLCDEYIEEMNNIVKKEDDNEIVSEEESNDVGLYTEYVQWQFINDVLYGMGERLLHVSERGRREFTNTIQRWLIFVNEHFNDVPKYEFFPILPQISADHAAAVFLQSAIIEKKLAEEEHAGDVVNRLLDTTSSYHNEVGQHDSKKTLYVRYDHRKKVIRVGRFVSPKIPRLQLLVRRAGLIAAAKMLLRYESFGNGSYQWGDPREVHRVLFEKFDVRYEGFASPINSRFIEFENTYFCSLFPETDKVFGSLGNFFHVDMDKHVGGWSVNPPFLIDLMKEVAERIIDVLDKGYKGYFFCTFPGWEGDIGWQLLNNSRHLRKRFNLKPQHFVVQDAYGNTFKPKMSMNMFLMGELACNVSKLTELGNILILDPRNSLPTDCDW